MQNKFFTCSDQNISFTSTITALYRDSRIHLSERKDWHGGFLRSAIPIEDNKHVSLDVVNQTGKLLCRLNIFNHSDGNSTVDVIVLNENKQTRAYTMEKGKRSEDLVSPINAIYVYVKEKQ